MKVTSAVLAAWVFTSTVAQLHTQVKERLLPRLIKTWVGFSRSVYDVRFWQSK